MCVYSSELYELFYAGDEGQSRSYANVCFEKDINRADVEQVSRTSYLDKSCLTYVCTFLVLLIYINK